MVGLPGRVTWVDYMSRLYDVMMAIESKEHGKELCGKPGGSYPGRPVTTWLQFGNMGVTTEA